MGIVLSSLFPSVFLREDVFTDPEKEDLQLLQHDKELIGGSSNRRLPALEKALLKLGRIPAVTLYRGILPSQVAMAKSQKFSLRGYQSFSESLEKASGFAESSGIVLELRHSSRPMFCYWKWLVDEAERIRREDPTLFDSMDGDFVIEAAREESEWITPFGPMFKSTGMEQRNGMQVISVSL